jgi:hypothetical protein
MNYEIKGKILGAMMKDGIAATPLGFYSYFILHNS